jgi:hypothetical protein
MMIQVKMVPTVARPNRPRPTATPTAAISQIPAAVVRPSSSRCCCNFKIAPAEKSDPRDESLQDERYAVVVHAGFDHGDHE